MKKFIPLTFLLPLILLSCTVSQEEPAPKTAADQIQVEISINSSGIAASSAVLDSEVEQLDILVVKNGIFQYAAQAYNSDYAVFRSMLKIDQNVDLYFFANCRYILTDDILEEGTAWENIQSQLVTYSTATSINGKSLLPMFGRQLQTDIQDNIINRFNVQLVRTVAVANVMFDLTPGKGYSFEPTKAYVYFGADRGLIPIREENLAFKDGKVSGVKEPVSPAQMTTDQTFSTPAVNGAFLNSLYMFDNDTDASSTGGNRRTRLVIGGYVNNAQTETFFPLDFSYTATNEILKVTRNSRYNLTITSVNTTGYPDPDTASDAVRVDLDYDVVEWNEKDHQNIAVDGLDYLSVSTKYMTVNRKAGSKSVIKLSGTFYKSDFDIQFSNSSVNGTQVAIADGIKNDRFSVEIDGSGTSLTVTVTALQDFSTANPALNEDKFIIQAGRISFDVDIEQLNTGGWDNGGNEGVDF